MKHLVGALVLCLLTFTAEAKTLIDMIAEDAMYCSGVYYVAANIDPDNINVEYADIAVNLKSFVNKLNPEREKITNILIKKVGLS